MNKKIVSRMLFGKVNRSFEVVVVLCNLAGNNKNSVKQLNCNLSKAKINSKLF